jgi:methanogenic corrinoid protein MtbC1
MLNLDEREFQQTLQQASTHKDFGTIVIEILFPFLRRVGMLWNLSEISPGHEHFISNLIKRNIHTAIQLLPNPAQQSPQYILYLVETELHEIGLLFAAYLLRQKGYRVLYLGQSVPIKSLESVLTQHNDTLLLTSVSTLQPLELFRQHLQKLSNYPHTILVACHPSIADKLKLVGNAHHIQLSEYFSQLPDYS